MTGKELILFLLGTGVAAGAGGVAAAVALDARAQSAEPDPAVLARLDDLQAAIDDANAGLAENRSALRRMDHRAQQVELDLSETGRRLASGEFAAAPVADSGLFPGAAMRLVDGDADGEMGVEAGSEAAQRMMNAALAKMPQRLHADAITLGEGTSISLSGALGGLTKGLELRKLPEEERWQKARDELGLTDAQINEIKSAVAERDAAVGDVIKVERTEDSRASEISVQNLDFAKARAADQAYTKRVDATLNEAQKKDWHEQGYDRAFGKMGMGITAGTVISVSSFEESSESAEER